ncbi:MAG TPA: hypothetical protein VJ993_00050, partial [Woeseiaceae bacterium]|nr:hypothetical protein [Woeseiaceae bacterium]
MRTIPVFAALGLTLVIALAACSDEPATPAAGIDAGAADGVSMSSQRTMIVAALFYREKIALPPGAVAVAAVEIAGSGTVVAETRNELADQSVPISVTLDVDRLRLPQ